MAFAALSQRNDDRVFTDTTGEHNRIEPLLVLHSKAPISRLIRTRSKSIACCDSTRSEVSNTACR